VIRFVTQQRIDIAPYCKVVRCNTVQHGPLTHG